MADARINALTEATSLDPTDWLVAEVGDSEARKVSVSTLNQALMATALPGSPVNGEQVVLTDSTTDPTYAWLLQYVDALAQDQWIFLGGSASTGEVSTAQTGSGSYADLATVGPSLTIPVDGNYLISFGFIGNTTAAGDGFMSPSGGGLVASDTLAMRSVAPSGTAIGGTRTLTPQDLTAGTLVAKYKGTNSFQDRWMQLLPVRIGG